MHVPPLETPPQSPAAWWIFPTLFLNRVFWAATSPLSTYFLPSAAALGHSRLENPWPPLPGSSGNWSGWACASRPQFPEGDPGAAAQTRDWGRELRTEAL